MRVIKTADVYSGAGGFRKAQDDLNQEEHPLKFRCVYSVDNDKFANRVYRKRWGEEGHYAGDIRTVNPEDIPDFDLLNAGFPCPAFSSAGKRAGFQDPRGALFYEICRIAEVKKPKMLFLENVEGIRWHNEGRTLAHILLRLRSLGYNVGYQIFNSRLHGVAQDRARCYFIGVLRDGGPRQILPLIENDRISTEQWDLGKMVQVAQSLRGRDYANWRGNFVAQDHAQSLTGDKLRGGSHALGNIIIAPKLAATLTAGEHAGGFHSNMTLVIDGYNKNIRADGLVGAIRTNRGGFSVLAFTATNPHNSEEKRVYRPTEVSRALMPSWSNQDTLIVDQLTGLLRRFTPTEEERLQGFPDDWTATGIDEKGHEVKISDHQRYRQMGNAVTVNVVRDISWFIRDAFMDLVTPGKH